MTPEEIDAVIDEAVEEEIASVREQAFVEAPDAEVAAAEASDPARTADEEPPDQEEWAALIRRMLVVYRQVGSR